MDYFIKDIVLDERFKQYKEISTNQPNTLHNLSKINIFVGANNSGKSRFLRILACTPKIKYIPNLKTWDFTHLEALRQKFLDALMLILTNYRMSDLNDIRQTVSKFPPFDGVGEGEALPASYKQELTRLSEMQVAHRPIPLSPGAHMGNGHTALNEINRLLQQYVLDYSKLAESLPTVGFKKIYFPILRGLRQLPQVGDVYRNKTIEDYFMENFKPEVFTGLGIYEELQQLLLGDLEDREIVRDFEQFLSKAFFQNQAVALLPKLKGQKVLNVKIGHEVEQAIHNLGDGIQTIIILLFPLFKHRSEKLLVFFEEPEIHLHPGLQRLFLSALKDFEGFQYFLTTHSNHFLDITQDEHSVSIYTFTKELEQSDSKAKGAKFDILNVSNERSPSLELLGVRNSSVFLSNCTIWVEGITDRRYLLHWLNLYMDMLQATAKEKNQPAPKRFREDLHFSFVEYGGANITHWSFLDSTPDPMVVGRLCGKLFLVTDKDNAEGAKKERQEKLRKELGDRYYCLESVEIENLLTPETIKAVVKGYEGESVPFQEFKQSDYQTEKLGKFIEEKVLAGAKRRAGSYAEASGTVSDKVNFCKKAIEATKSYPDLSEEAKALTEKIYEFIKKHNQ